MLVGNPIAADNMLAAGNTIAAVDNVEVVVGVVSAVSNTIDSHNTGKTEHHKVQVLDM